MMLKAAIFRALICFTESMSSNVGNNIQWRQHSCIHVYTFIEHLPAKKVCEPMHETLLFQCNDTPVAMRSVHYSIELDTKVIRISNYL